MKKNKLSRRDFVQLSGLASTSLLVPGFLKCSENKILINESLSHRKLVVIQLSGGNDGLNTVVPYRNDVYYSSRPSLAISRSNILDLDGEMGLNGEMRAMKKIYDEGYMSIINNVGYPNPNRSHFRSLDIWHTASNSDEYLKSGWLGNYLDSTCSDCKSPHKVIEVDGTLSLAVKGRKNNGIAVENPALLHKTVSDPLVRKLATNSSIGAAERASSYLYKTLIQTASSADYIYEKSKIYRSSLAYPANNELAKKLRVVSELIISGIDTSVFYVSMSGYDTHIKQQAQHDKLLQFMSDAVGLFCLDLEKNGKLDDTMIVVFSEFGRRVKENASSGTDHGTANNMFIINKNLKKAGIYNETPDLNNLDSGDLKFKTDFRSVYATVLENWLGSNSQAILGREFDKLKFI
ncbi:MAG: DUF1501 domain-containing protein [Chitinophagales bacterium]|nr:DUF1501 domain-containing protein [Chitinophagales bacterium]